MRTYLVNSRFQIQIVHPVQYLRCVFLVTRMAWHMWRQLTRPGNMAKGGWWDTKNSELMLHARLEISEAERVNGQGGLQRRLWDEAADCANLMAMAAENSPDGSWAE